MAIIPWEPFRNLDKFFEEDWDLLPVIPFKGIKVPEVDIYQTDKDVVVEMPLAGVKPEDVEISVEDNILTAKGKTEEEKEEKKKNYYRKEIRKGAFERSVALPVEVKGERTKADSQNGMLKITLPKVKAKKSKKIQVKVKK
jgi:HSP20 family protein